MPSFCAHPRHPALLPPLHRAAAQPVQSPTHPPMDSFAHVFCNITLPRHLLHSRHSIGTCRVNLTPSFAQMHSISPQWPAILPANPHVPPPSSSHCQLRHWPAPTPPRPPSSLLLPTGICLCTAPQGRWQEAERWALQRIESQKSLLILENIQGLPSHIQIQDAVT